MTKRPRLLSVRNRSTLQPLKSAYIDHSRRANGIRPPTAPGQCVKPGLLKQSTRARSHNRPVAFVVADEKKRCAWADAN